MTNLHSTGKINKYHMPKYPNIYFSAIELAELHLSSSAVDKSHECINIFGFSEDVKGLTFKAEEC